MEKAADRSKKMAVRRWKWVFGIAVLILLAAFFLWRMVRPLNIFVVDERFERPVVESVPEGLSSLSARECGGCHEDIYREWAESMHAQAWRESYFQVDFKYDGSQQICLNCHTPLENQQENLVLGFQDRDKFKPILKPNPSYDPTLGVTCRRSVVPSRAGVRCEAGEGISSKADILRKWS